MAFRANFETTKNWLTPLGLSPQDLNERTHALYKTQPRKKLVTYGTVMDPSTLSVSDCEAQPLDGFITKLFTGSVSAPTQQSNDSFSATRHTYASWASALALWQQHTFTNVTANFFIVQTGAAPQADWWNDTHMATLVANMRDLAQVAKEAEFEGLCFDLEAYSPSKPFQYTSQAQYPTKTKAEYRTKAKYWGHVMMDEMISAFPDIKILTFQSFHAYLSNEYAGDSSDYGLLGAFLDGLLDSAKKNRWSLPHRVILTNEVSYNYKVSAEFNNAAVYNQDGAWAGESAGFGVYNSSGLSSWLDYGGTFNYNDLSQNYFTASQWQSALSVMLTNDPALSNYDYTTPSGISWIYTQIPKFFNQAPSTPVPQAYLDAIRAAKDYAGLKVW